MRSLLIVTALAAGLQAQTTAEENLNLGVRAFKAGDYSEATSRFKAAVALDPEFPGAMLYLGTAYIGQYIPGVETAENQGYAEAAIAAFRNVLGKDPKNLLATKSLASLYYNLKDFGAAREWNRQLLAIDANNTAALYTLGVIAWTEFIGADRDARQRERMKPSDPAPLKDPGDRAVLKAKFWQSLTDGIEYEKLAVGINPAYADAMAYLNLLIRYRADLDDTPEQAQADIEEADSWIGKALQARKDQAARAAQNLQTPH